MQVQNLILTEAEAVTTVAVVGGTLVGLWVVMCFCVLGTVWRVDVVRPGRAVR
jgi:hypothetical protein